MGVSAAWRTCLVPGLLLCTAARKAAVPGSLCSGQCHATLGMQPRVRFCWAQRDVNWLPQGAHACCAGPEIMYTKAKEICSSIQTFGEAAPTVTVHRQAYTL